MFAHSWPLVSAVSGRRITHGFIHPSRLAALGVTALLAGCAAPAAPVVGVHPADPDAPTRPAAYRSVTGSYASQRPRDPTAWDDTNARVAPKDTP